MSIMLQIKKWYHLEMTILPHVNVSVGHRVCTRIPHFIKIKDFLQKFLKLLCVQVAHVTRHLQSGTCPPTQSVLSQCKQSRTRGITKTVTRHVDARTQPSRGDLQPRTVAGSSHPAEQSWTQLSPSKQPPYDLPKAGR